MNHQAHLLAVTLACLGLTVASTAPCQDPHEHTQQHASLSVLVNGATAPERIPDELAYAHLVLAIALSESPSREEELGRDALLAQIALSKRDQTSLIAALSGVRTQLAFLDREIARLSLDPERADTRLHHLRVHRTKILSESHVRLLARLTEQGQSRLRDYIKTHVKPQISVYADTQESTDQTAVER